MKIFSRLVFIVFFLSFFRLSVDEVGSFIVLDVVAVLYFMAKPRRLLRYPTLLIWLSFSLIALLWTYLILGVNEFPYIVRVFLIFIDAFFLDDLFKSKWGLPQYVFCSRCLLLAAAAYFFAFVTWLILPDFDDTIFYLKSFKSWIATFPALFAVGYLVANRPKPALALSLVSMLLAFFDDSVSRALLTQSIGLQLICLWKLNRRLFISAAVIMIVSSIVFMSSIDAFVEKNDHSNTFRKVMIMQIFDFSFLEFVLGRGIDLWRLSAFNMLYDMPGADSFFETANPHFFPAEIIIRGGLLLLVCVFFAFYSAFRRSQVIAIPVVMLVGTFFTTNTGVERLYMTLAIFILLSSVQSNISLQKTLLKNNSL